MNLQQRASRYLTRHLLCRPLPLRGPVGVVSFTFDDAPLSACQAGAAVLERHGVRGTYYVAGGLTDGKEEGLACHSEAALRHLLAAGHQLGAHSFSHVHVNRLAGAARAEEFRRSAAFLEGLGVAGAQVDFAYPFGGVSLGAKRDAGRTYRSSRATGGGTHVGMADLNRLKPHRFYRSAPDGVGFAECLAVAARQRGWLVVNTHEVQPDAGAFGCTPQALDEAVSRALDAGCRVLSVSAALDHWQQQQQQQQRAGGGAAG